MSFFDKTASDLVSNTTFNVACNIVLVVLRAGLCFAQELLPTLKNYTERTLQIIDCSLLNLAHERLWCPAAAQHRGQCIAASNIIRPSQPQGCRTNVFILHSMLRSSLLPS